MKRDRDQWIAEQILEGHYKGFYQLKMWPLDSYSAFSIEYNGKMFPTAEHLYQARKFEGTNRRLFKEIRCSRSPQYAKTIAHLPDNEQYVQEDWDAVKVEIMRDICARKLSQHPYIKDKLFESRDLPLAEFSKSDSFWGIGEDGSGLNMLGRIWEELRVLIKPDEMDVETLKKGWPSVILDVKGKLEVNDIAFKTWLQPLEIVSFENDCISLKAPEGSLGTDYIKRKYYDSLVEAVITIYGREYEIEFV